MDDERGGEGHPVTVRAAQEPVGWGRTRLLGLFATLICSFAFVSFWWNRCLPVTADGYLALPELLKGGSLPYRDFWCFVPPLDIVLVVGILKAFGDRLVAVYATGVALWLATAALLYVWLSRHFRPAVAFFAAAVTFVASLADVINIPLHYNHGAIFLAIASGLLLDSGLVQERARRAAACFLGAGLLIGLCGLMKQTHGPLLLAAAVAVLVLARRRFEAMGFTRTVLLPLLAGTALPLLAALVFLARYSLVGPFLHQITTGGMAAKGGAAGVFLRPILGLVQVPWLWDPFLVACLCVVAMGPAWKLAERYTPSPEHRERGAIWLALAGVLAAMLAGTLQSASDLVTLRSTSLVAVYVTLVGLVLLTIPLLGRERRSASSVEETRLLMALAISLAASYGFSLSWSAFEAMTIPGLGFVLGWALSRSPTLGLHRAIRFGIVALCLALVGITTFRKFLQPTDWNGWYEPPVWVATQEPKLPELAGFRLSTLTSTFLQETTAAVTTHTRPDDRILVFPFMADFYGLTHRKPTTVAFMHWFDVCPDALAESDAELIRRSPPAAIVRMVIPPRSFLLAEEVFRGGRPSGQRKLAQAIAGLLKDYVLVRRSDPFTSGVPIEVWIRADRMKESAGGVSP